jgi:hypothetical protein
MCSTIRHHEYAFQVPMVMPPANKPNPAMGVRKLEMSATGRYMATVNDSQRTAVWLWDLHVLSLVCVLKHEQPVVSLAWDPVHDKLAICTASRRCAAFALSPPFFLVYLPPSTHYCFLYCGMARKQQHSWNDLSPVHVLTTRLLYHLLLELVATSKSHSTLKSYKPCASLVPVLHICTSAICRSGQPQCQYCTPRLPTSLSKVRCSHQQHSDVQVAPMDS